MARDKELADKVVLNKWELHITHWYPAQIYYYFQDKQGGKWSIYLRWDGQRGDEPWTAELVTCDDDWEYRWDSPDFVNLLKEKNHVPGVVTGYYYDEEYPFLMEKVLELMKERFPDLDFPDNR